VEVGAEGCLDAEVIMAATATEPRIVVGIDGSPDSQIALEWAVRQAELTSSTLEVVTTWEWPNTYGAPFALPAEYDPDADARRVLEEAVAPIHAAHPSVTIRASAVKGPPAPTLVDLSQGADLLVVGSRGHGEFAGMLIGSVSNHCVSHAHCSVVVVRPPAEASR
jgi:nucleotide-binding universal stress UspA family protein